MGRNLPTAVQQRAEMMKTPSALGGLTILHPTAVQGVMPQRGYGTRT